MDKQLKNLKEEFEQIPTSFTDKDRQSIRSKIEKLPDKKVRKSFHFYPQLLTGVVIAAAVLILVVTFNQQPNMFMSSDKASDTSGNEMAEESSIADAKMKLFEAETEDSISGETKNAIRSDESLDPHVFNPEVVQFDMNFPVLDVQQNGDGKIITFASTYTLSGNFVDDGQLIFELSEASWQQIPVAEGDANKEIPVYISNEDFARSVFDVGKGTSTEFTLKIQELEYHYSPEGSSIYLKVENEDGFAGIEINTYNESLTLSDELLAVYKDYKISLDDTVLKGLNPFDVFKLYHYADYQGDLEVQYALYFDKENHYVPDKETFLAEVNRSEQQAKEFYNEMLKIETFEELYLTENEALILYNIDHQIGFRLFRDKELDVWKVSWMPIQ